MQYSLHLDGVIQFAGTIAGYGWKVQMDPQQGLVDPKMDQKAGDDESFASITKIDTSTWKPEVLCRIMIIVQAALLVAIYAVKHVVRALAFCVASAMNSDLNHLSFAGRDFLSLIVQSVALPILDIIAIVMPKIAAALARAMRNTFNKQCEVKPTSPKVVSFNPFFRVFQPFILIDDKISLSFSIIIRASALIQTIVNYVHGIFRNLFTFVAQKDQYQFFLGISVYPVKNMCTIVKAAKPNGIIQFRERD